MANLGARIQVVPDIEKHIREAVRTKGLELLLQTKASGCMCSWALWSLGIAV